MSVVIVRAGMIHAISQETLVEKVGTTRSRFNAFVNGLRKFGFVGYNGKLEVHSSLLNVMLHTRNKPR